MSVNCSHLSHLQALQVIPHSGLQLGWHLEYLLLMVHQEGHQVCGKELIQLLLLCTAQDTAGKRLDQLQRFSTASVDKTGICSPPLHSTQWHKPSNTNFQVWAHKEGCHPCFLMSIKVISLEVNSTFN